METDNRPLVSVVVPVYNAEGFLKDTVQTIEEQTLKNLEILLVDDGSKDESLRICRELAKEDVRIKVFHKENGGAASARNLGIRNARGSFIGFVDSDDRIEKTMYEDLLRGAKVMEDEGKENFIVQIGRREVNEKGEALPDVVIPPVEDTFVPAISFAESLLLYTGDASFCTSLVPAAYMKQHLFPEGITGEDFRLLMEMVDTMDGVYRLSARGYTVVHRKGSVTRRQAGSFSRVYRDIIVHADFVEQEMVRKYPELQTPALRFGLYERLDYMLHVPVKDMNRGNAFYTQVVAYLRKNFFKMLSCENLTAKNKGYLVLLTLCPRLTRKVHWALRGKKILKEETASR